MTRPSIASPTGTLIGVPLGRTTAPRAKPAGRLQRHRAHGMRVEVQLNLGDRRALAVLDDERLVEGGQHAVSNCTSTTEPRTARTMPVVLPAWSRTSLLSTCAVTAPDPMTWCSARPACSDARRGVAASQALADPLDYQQPPALP